MTSANLPTGTAVVYVGSITECRGPAFVLGGCLCESCRGLNRLALVTAGGEILHHVRAESVARFRGTELASEPFVDPFPCQILPRPGRLRGSRPGRIRAIVRDEWAKAKASRSAREQQRSCPEPVLVITVQSSVSVR